MCLRKRVKERYTDVTVDIVGIRGQLQMLILSFFLKIEFYDVSCRLLSHAWASGDSFIPTS